MSDIDSHAHLLSPNDLVLTESNQEFLRTTEENPLDAVGEPDQSGSNSIDEDAEPNDLKYYQETLQDFKEEIARLNKLIEYKSKDNPLNPTEEEVFKLKAMCKYSKQEIKDLNAKLEEINKLTEKTSENIENLKSSSFDETTSNEKIETLTRKVKELEEEYSELIKTNNEINITDLDKILSPEANLKLVNEFFVNFQKRLGVLDSENANLALTLKKYNQETLKLKEKCDKASSRYKSNDELKNKLKELEDNYYKCSVIEERLTDELKQAEEELSIHSTSPENKLDVPSAQKMLADIEILAKKDKEEIEKLEFQLQEKKNILRAAKAYGIQRSKTSNKLRSDMELLGLVLIEKDQMISKLKKEIEEIQWKHVQTEIEIKELTKKN
jgi:hypothetical protein